VAFEAVTYTLSKMTSNKTTDLTLRMYFKKCHTTTT